MDDPPMGDPTVEDEPLKDPRVGDPPEKAHPVNDSPEEDPPGEDEEVRSMEEDGQDHPVKRDAAFEGVAAFPHHLKESRHSRKLFLWLVYLHVPPSIAVTALEAYGRF